MALTISAITVDPGVDSTFVAKGVTDAAGATAQTIYIGWTPRRIEVLNITDQLTDLFVAGGGMVSGDSRHCLANGTWTDAVANGFTLLDGTEAPVAAASRATGSPGTSGQGFTIGTGPLVASKTFTITAWK